MFSLNMNLLPMKAHYFFYNAGTAPVVPFIPTLAKQLGFSSVLVGTLYTILPIMGMIAKPTMGAIADRFKCRKTVFLAFLLLIIASTFPLLYVPGLPSEVKAELHCKQMSDVKICGVNSEVADKLIAEGSNNTTIPCKMSCVLNATFLTAACQTWNWTGLCEHNKPTLTILSDNQATVVPPPHNVIFQAHLAPLHTLAIKNTECMFTKVSRVELDGLLHVPYCNSLQTADCTMQCTKSRVLSSLKVASDAKAVKHYQFWLFTGLMVLSWVGMAVVVSIGDAICFSILGEQPTLFGYQRMWGSVGYGLFVILAGWLVDAWSGDETNKDYTPVFYLMAAMLALDFIVSYKIQYTQKPHTSSILNNVGKLFKDIQVVVFLLWLVFVGLCTALIWNFLLWYLEDLAEQSTSVTHQYIKTLEGLVNGIQCLGGELVFLFLSDSLLKRIGHIHAMSLVLFAFGIRFLLYSTLTNPWWSLPIELLHGPTYGLLYATMANHASLIAPPGTDTTVQGLVGAIFEGIGVSTGSFIAGLLFDRMSGVVVFRICGLAVLVVCVLHICLQFFLSRRHTLSISQGKEFNNGAVYASPSEAINMLDEPSYQPLSNTNL